MRHDGKRAIELTRYCPGCGMQVSDTAGFCPYCGRALNPAPSYSARVGLQNQSTIQTIRDIGRAVGAYTSLGILALLLIDVGILIWSISVILPIAANPAHGTTLYLLWPGPNPIVPLFALDGLAFGFYHILIVVAITSSFIFMVYKSGMPLRRELNLEMPKDGHSPIYRITTIFLAVMSVNLIYTALILIFNVSVTTPGFSDMQLWQLLHAFAAASVWEELITRVLWLGVPLLLIDLAMRNRSKLRYYFLGGSRTFGRKELIFIWVSATVFSLGHIVYWDAFKLLPTFAAGIGFGFLFIRYGLYSCILFHFANDYLTIPAMTLNSVPLLEITSIVVLCLGFLGIPYLIVYLRRMILFVTGRDLKAKPFPAPVAAAAASQAPPSQDQGRSLPASQTPQQSPAQGGTFFTCVNCGWHEARMVEGKLECTRCLRKQ
ncbi:MAG: CPBP family intramembrane glutamic endopeptidase [Methanomassiliicoccales archaeon]|jgi:hypothetical protein